MKKVLLVLTSLVAALAAVVLIVPSFFDWNSQKALIEEQGSLAVGQPVRIAGDLSLAILPKPHLMAGGLTVGDKDDLTAGPYVSAGLIDIRVAFLPLLSGKIEASRVLLEKPEIIVLTRQAQPPDTGEEPEETSATTLDFALPEVIIDDGKITLLDAGTQAQTTVSNINLTLSADSLEGPFGAEGALDYEGTPINISAQTNSISGTENRFDASVSVPSAGGLAAKVSGSVHDMLGEALGAQGTLDITATDLSAALATLAGDGNAALSGRPLDGSAALSFENNVLAISDLRIRSQDIDVTGTGSVAVGSEKTVGVMTLSMRPVDLSPFMSGEPRETDALLEPIEAALPENLEFTLNATVEALEGLPIRIDRITVQTRVADSKLVLQNAEAMLPGGVMVSSKGELSPQGDVLTGPLSVKIAGANAQTLLRQLMGPEAALPPAPIPLDMTLDGLFDAEEFRLRAMVGKLGETTLSGSARVSYGTAPNVGLNARFGTVNLDDWTGQTPAKPSEPNDAQAAPFGGTLIADVAVEQLLRGGETFNGLQLRGTIKDDVLQLETLQLGEAPGGEVAAQGRIVGLSSDNPTLDLTYKAAGQSANQLLALAGQAPNDMLSSAGAVALGGAIKGTAANAQATIAGTIGAMTLDGEASARSLGEASQNAKGTLRLNHKNPAQFLADLELIDASMVGRSSGPLKLTSTFVAEGDTISADMVAVTTEGRLNARYAAGGERLELAVAATAKDITQFINGLGFVFDPAGSRLGGLDVAMSLAGPLEALLARDLKLNIGPAKLQGSGQFDISGDVTQVDLRFTGDNFDLAALMPEAETGAQQAKAGTGERWSREPLELDGLEAIDGVVRLDLGRLTWENYELTDARLSLSSQGKSIRAALERGQLFSGPASLAIALDGRKALPILNVDIGVKGGDIAKATQSSAAIAPLTGTFDLTGKFSGIGASQFDLVQTLVGEARFAAQDGVINGIDIVRVNERFGNLSTVADFVSVAGSALRGGQTAYDVISVDVVAQDGVITTQNMVTQIDGGAKASLAAKINLPQWSVSSTGSFALADHPDAPPVGVTMVGALDSPEITYETEAIQNYLGVRFGTAVLKGVVRGEGFGFKDLIGGRQQQTSGTQSSGEPTELNTTAEETQEDAGTPEEQLRDLILEGLFKRKRN
ncbi:MAG: AsmA family protein [Pseudomonadota bacterium]